MATQDEIKVKAQWAQATLAALALVKEISLAVLTVVAQYFQFKAKKAEVQADSLQTELNIRDKLDEHKKESENKTDRQRIDDFLSKPKSK